MALILHLFDLHLSNDSEVIGDPKVKVVDKEALTRRINLIRSTLTELGESLRNSDQVLDAIVISGDVTDRGNSSGFDLLEGVLEELGGSLPPKDRIMIVPGNHDVVWYTKSSSQARYVNFIKGVRDKGYVTPLLEGIDIDPGGRLMTGAKDPTIVAGDGSFIIVGLNSSNHCGIELDPEPEVAEFLQELDSRSIADAPLAALLAAWRSRGRFDVARLDPSQRSHASRALRSARTSISELDVSPALIAVMHHQLVPVSNDEEIKPFDALTNLGEVREWLAGNDVDVVLHGHKHIGMLAKETFRTNMPGGLPPIKQILIAATGTIGHGQSRRAELAKLLSNSQDLWMGLF